VTEIRPSRLRLVRAFLVEDGGIPVLFLVAPASSGPGIGALRVSVSLLLADSHLSRITVDP